MNFEDKNERLTSARATADELVDIFVDAGRKRARWGDENNILGLSGGHDSRAVAAGLAHDGVRCRAVTGVAKGRQHAVEIESAMHVAKVLGIPHQTYETPLADLAMHREMIRINDGHITTANSSSISDLRFLRDVFGSDVTYISGDGGDKALPDLRLPHRSSSLDELAFEIGRSYGSHGLPPDVVSKLTGVPIEDLYHELVKLLASYPEQDLEQKGVHFAIYERARRFVFEGEDHKRAFLAWQTSPFFSWPFFEAAMRVPDRLKQDRRLYRHFLRRLSPETASVPLTNVGVGPSSPTYLARTWARRRYDALPWSVRDRIKGRFKRTGAPGSADSTISAAIQDSRSRPGGIGSIMARAHMGIVPDQHLLTLALLTELWPQGKQQPAMPQEMLA